MNKPYVRATPIGYNTGKVIIGRCWIPPKKRATSSEVFICGVLRGTERISILSTITAQIKAKIRMVKEKRNGR